MIIIESYLRIGVLMGLVTIGSPAFAQPSNRGGVVAQKKQHVTTSPSPIIQSPVTYQIDDSKGGAYEERCAPKEPSTQWNDKRVQANQNEICRRLDAAGSALDKAERHAAEWGHASIASAVLVKSVNSSRFSINIGPEKNYNYFEEKIRSSAQGAASRYSEKSLGVSAEVQLGQSAGQKWEDRIESIKQQTRAVEAEYLLKEARKRLDKLDDPLQSEKVPTETPVVPNSEASDTVTEPVATTSTSATDALLPPLAPSFKDANGSVTNVFVDSQFNPAQSLLARGATPKSGESPDLTTLALIAEDLKPSEGDILKAAGSNVVTKNLLNYLTSPVEVGSNQVAWFMVTQVSVSPGARTWHDYVAETTLHPYYAKLNGETVVGDFDPGKVHPGIFAAFPLLEAQALDLRNSERSETRLSFALAAKLIAEGKHAEAKFFLEKVTKIQQDMATSASSAK